MKAAVQTTRRRPARAKKRSRGYSVHMYRARKEVSAAGTKAPDFLSSRLSFPTPLVLRLLSSEASRLSRSNRLKVVTLQEVNAAVALVQRRMGTKAAA